MGHSNRRDSKHRNKNNKAAHRNQPNLHVQEFSEQEKKNFSEKIENMMKQDAALQEFKTRKVFCAKCGQQIMDVAMAMADKKTGEPVHFDCVLDEIKSGEKLSENDRLTYIGQGKFAVLHFDNIRDLRHFKIIKTIEWEPRDSVYEWRSEMAGVYSQVI